MKLLKLIISKLNLFLTGTLSFFSKKNAERFLFWKKEKKDIYNDSQAQINMDKKLVYSLSRSRIPNLRQLKYIKKFLSPKELWIIRVCSWVIILSGIFWAGMFYFRHLEIMPVKGGEYREALIGSPKYINPLYSNINDVDNDISSLVYSSLYKRGKNGELNKDLVESYEISKDNKIYSFKIIANALWHDNKVLTAKDVKFTFDSISDGQYKSSLRSSFLGVKAELVDDRNIRFVLNEPYAAFLELLTFGVMPAHLWQEIPANSAQLAELNLKPIGSGPYIPGSLKKLESGQIKEYSLKVNESYYGQIAKVDLRFKFYPSIEEVIGDLNNQLLDGISYLPSEYKDGILTPNSYNFQKLFLPQLTLIFFNQQRNVALADKALRQALAYAINQNSIVNDTLLGDAYVVNGPILPNNFAYDQGIKKYDYSPETATKLLDGIDWRLEEITPEQVVNAQNEVAMNDKKAKATALEIVNMGAGKWRKKNGKFLVIDLKTVDRGENGKVLQEVQKYWEALGVKTKVEIFSAGEIQNQVLKQRNFDALFYGQVVGSDPDPYAFWHSSQIGGSSFNIANFSNKDVDQLLEDARQISDQIKRTEYYKKFQTIISEEEPAIFMYSPVYTYLQSNKLKGFNVSAIFLPRDRFSNIEEWYLKEGKRLLLK